MGLILVIVAGIELFTDNKLIVMAYASKSVRTMVMLRNSILGYLGNFIVDLDPLPLIHLEARATILI